MSFNKVFLIGRITKDLELRKTSSGLSVVQFTLAVRRYKKGDEEVTDFPSCIAWRGSADYLCNYAKKGDLIALSGEIQTRKYEGSKGTQYVTEVVADEVRILASKKEETSKPQDKPQGYQPTLAGGDGFYSADIDKFGGNLNNNGLDINSDDLPFY